MHKFIPLLALLPMSLFAQQAAPAPQGRVEPQNLAPEQKYTREQMVEMLAQQETVVEALSEQFFSLNEEIETRIQNIVDGIAKLEDSDASGTRVSHMKKRVIEDLKKGIHALQQRRNANAATLARLPAYRQEGAVQGRAVEFLDDKLKLRIDQVMTMAGSLHQHKDVRKYTYTFDTDYYGSNDVRVRRRKSDEWKSNRQQTINAEMQRGDLIEQIEAAEKRITNEINHIKAEMVRANLQELPPAQAKQVEEKEELLNILKSKKMEVLEGKGVATESVGSRQRAMEIERQLNNAVQDLRVTNNQLRQLGIRLGQELQRLDAQQQVLARHDAAAKAGDMEKAPEMEKKMDEPAPQQLPN